MNAVTHILNDRLPDLPLSRPRYWSALVNACNVVDPPYGLAWYGEMFREAAMDLDWVCRLLVVNAQKEAEGARQLWTLAGRIQNANHRNRVRLHAIDESRHASFYISLLELTFPDSVTKDQLESLRRISPGFKSIDEPEIDQALSEAEILDELIQMNIGEIRTLVNQMLMRPVIEVVAPRATNRQALKLIDSLGDDELSHVAYTADLVEELSKFANVDDLMQKRTAEFAQITCREIGAASELLEFYA
jgi:hypothetical protein